MANAHSSSPKVDEKPRIMAYSLPRRLKANESGAIAIPYGHYEYDEFVLIEKSLESSESFMDYDGVVLFAGCFERSDSNGMTSCRNIGDLQRRERELVTNFEKDKPIVFLVPGIARYFVDQFDSLIQKGNDTTDLFRKVLFSFGVGWDRSQTDTAFLNSRIPEFEDYVSNYGTASIHFFPHSPPVLPHYVICRNTSAVLGFEFSHRLFFLPCYNVSDHDKSLQIAESAVQAVLKYRKRISKEMPLWIEEFRFTNESYLLGEIDKHHRQIDDLNAKLDPYSQWKGLLCLQSDPLVQAVETLLRTFFGITIKLGDKKGNEKIDDASIVDENGTTLVVIEIKSANGSFKLADINQVDTHRERLDLPETVPGLLIMNTMLQAESLEEKDHPPDAKVLSRAVSQNVLMIRTLDLLRYVDLVERGTIEKAEFLKTILTNRGWLKVENDQATVIQK